MAKMKFSAVNDTVAEAADTTVSGDIADTKFPEPLESKGFEQV